MISRANFLKVAAYIDSIVGRKSTELDFINPYTFAVSVILSAQATDKGVNKATPALFAVADTPDKMLELGYDGLREYVKSINFYNNKSKLIIAMSEKLLSDYGGILPMDRNELEKLPGIGRKSANVIMNEMAGAPTIAVDTHVLRLSQRLDFAAAGAGPLEVEESLEKLTPPEDKPFVSNWFVLFGRYHCTAKKPKCAECGLHAYCGYWKEVSSKI